MAHHHVAEAGSLVHCVIYQHGGLTQGEAVMCCAKCHTSIAFVMEMGENIDSGWLVEQNASGLVREAELQFKRRMAMTAVTGWQ